MSSGPPNIATALAHAGCEIDPLTGAVTPAIHLSSTFERDKDLGWATPQHSFGRPHHNTLTFQPQNALSCYVLYTPTHATIVGFGNVPAMLTHTLPSSHASSRYSKGFCYGRGDNPTRALLERTLAKLEGGHSCAAFSSGQAAANAILQSIPGGHIIMSDDMFVLNPSL